MTLLGKADLIALLRSRELQFEPELDAFQLQPNGIDIRLGYDFRIPKMWRISEKGREALSLIDYLENSEEKFEELTLDRKLELKKRIHVFLKRVERRYGEMDDIFFTPCGSGDELCSEHGLTEGYLTLETHENAELHLGLKYINERWRRYTVGFNLPGMNYDKRTRRGRAPGSR